MNSYTGWKKVNFTDEDLNAFYSGEFNLDELALKENQYLLIEDQSEDIVDKYKFQDGRLNKIKYQMIGDKTTTVYKPRNIEQELAFDLLNDETIPVKVLTGVWGSLKTGSMVVKALELVMEEKFSRLIWVRQPVIMKDCEEIGFLKGDEFMKLAPFCGPLIDKCGTFMFERLLNEGKIEVQNIGFLRGRSITDSIVLCSEAQNITTSTAKVLLTRIEENSQLWLEGDIKGQQDKKIYANDNGLDTLISSLSGDRLFGHVTLTKNERGPIAKLVSRFPGEE